jgi:DNA primase
MMGPSSMVLGNVHLTPQLVQAVRDTIDVAEIAARYTKLEKMGGGKLRGLCPVHKEKTPSFNVDPVKGLYYCFGCGAGGDAIRLHMTLTGDEFAEAIENLARDLGIPLPSRSGGTGHRRERDLEEVLSKAEEFFTDRLERSPGTRDYLGGRRISETLIERFRLGYAPDDFQALLSALRPSISLEDLEAAGLIGRSSGPDQQPYDRFRHRLMFPIRNPSGRLVGFGGRTLGEDRAKYINTKETERFRKRSLLYGLDVSRRAIREKGSILVVEGYFDLLAAVAAGVDWVVATMGTALSAEQVRLCARYADTVVLCYDGDKAGQEAQRRALPLLLGQKLAVRKVVLSEGADPDTVRLQEGDDALSAHIEASVDAVEAELDEILPRAGDIDPPTQARCATAVQELLRAIPEPILRHGYGRRAADRLGIPYDGFWQAPQQRDSREQPAASQESVVRLVTSLEERALQLLLTEGTGVVGLGDLPSADVFFDASCGNIYRQFLGLYTEDGSPPTAEAVLVVLSHDGEALDRVARILLQGSSCSDADELRESLRQLNRRWRQHRLKILAQQINEAQRAGDASRLNELVEEKTSLTRLLHDLDRGPEQSEV